MLLNLLLQSKVEKEVGREALALGLLIGTEDDTHLEEEVDGQLCFPHISFQEFASGKYLAQLSKVRTTFLKDKCCRYKYKFLIACHVGNLSNMLYFRLSGRFSFLPGFTFECIKKL